MHSSHCITHRARTSSLQQARWRDREVVPFLNWDSGPVKRKRMEGEDVSRVTVSERASRAAIRRHRPFNTAARVCSLGLLSPSQTDPDCDEHECDAQHDRGTSRSDDLKVGFGPVYCHEEYAPPAVGRVESSETHYTDTCTTTYVYRAALSTRMDINS